MSGFAANYANFEDISASQEAVVPADDGLIFMGFSAHESAVSPGTAHFHIIDGETVAGGTVMVSTKMTGSETREFWVGDRGIRIPNGLTIGIASGTIDITVYYVIAN